METELIIKENNYTLLIDYKTREEKEQIFDVNEIAITKFHISPNMYIKSKKIEIGQVILEFLKNNEKINVDYFEFIIKELKLKIIKNKGENYI